MCSLNGKECVDDLMKKLMHKRAPGVSDFST